MAHGRAARALRLAASMRVRARGVTTNTCPMAPYRGVSPAGDHARDGAADGLRRGAASGSTRSRSAAATWCRRSRTRTATGLAYDEGTYRAGAGAAAERDRLRRVPRAPAGGAGRGALPRHRLCRCSTSAPATARPAFAARAHGHHAGLRAGRAGDGPVGLRRGPDRRLAARPGPADDACAADRRRARRRARRTSASSHGDTDRDALRLGHFRQPLAGDRRRRLQARGRAAARAQLAAVAGQLLEADAADIELGDGAACVRGTDLGDRAAGAGARRLSPEPPLRRRSPTRACRSAATYDPAGTFSNACHVAIVEVDLETGHVAIERFSWSRTPAV